MPEPERQPADYDTLINTLCHYTTADTAFRHILPTATLRMSPYGAMRDPLENRELSFQFGTGLYGQPPELTERQVRVTRSIRSMRDEMRILCFTVDAPEDAGYTVDDVPFMCGWARPRMWEQYGDNHAGACIAFDFGEAVGYMRADLNTIGIEASGNVHYSHRGFAGTDAAALQLDGLADEESAVFAEFVLRHDRDLFFTKTLDWQTEYEFRLTLWPNTTANEELKAGYYYVGFGGASSIRGVILGENFPEWQIGGAKEICDDLGVQLFRMVWRDGLPWAVPIPFPA